MTLLPSPSLLPGPGLLPQEAGSGPVAAPGLASVAQDLADGLEALCALDVENAYAAQTLLAAVGAMWQGVDDLIRDTDVAPGWASIVDVELAPVDAFGFLAQLAGVQLTAGAPEDQQRDEIRKVDGQRRGLLATIKAAVAPFLTGTLDPNILERTDPSSGLDKAYHITLRLRTAEFPAGLVSPQGVALTAAFLGSLPAGLIGHIVISDSQTYDELNIAKASYNLANSGYTDYIDMRDLP